MTGVVLAIVIVVVGSLFLFKKTREPIVGICLAALDQTVRKQANKEKAVAFVRERGQASNADLQAHLHVSARTVVNYMDELEKAGRIEQVGETGRAVVYRPR